MPNAIMFVSESLELYRELCKALQDVAPLIPTPQVDDLLTRLEHRQPRVLLLDGAIVRRQTAAAMRRLTEYLAMHDTSAFLLLEREALVDLSIARLKGFDLLFLPLNPLEIRHKVSHAMYLRSKFLQIRLSKETKAGTSEPMLAPGNSPIPTMPIVASLNQEPVRPRVLIVDDYQGNLDTLTAGLEDVYSITCTPSPKEALVLSKTQVFDIILSDVLMPEMSGYMLCEAIKKESLNQETPFIFVTALDQTSEESKGLALGAVDYITKPYSLAIVRARIQNHLELYRTRDALKALSLIDSLTGLPNRRHFEQVYSYQWMVAQRHGRPITVALVDIDYFKQYNDGFGHQKGDECLQSVGKALASVCHRSMDFVARYGGEEFVIVLCDTDTAGAVLVGQTLLNSVRQLAIETAPDTPISVVSISIGMASCYPVGTEDPNFLINLADQQLYKAKRSGRDRIACTSFDPVAALSLPQPDDRVV